MMKRVGLVVGISSILTSCGMSPSAIGQSTTSTAQAQSETLAQNVSVQELKAEMGSDRKLLIIDVRDPSQFAAGHIPGSVNGPFNSIFSWYRTLDPKAHIVTLDQAGQHSGLAAAFLFRQGFTTVGTLVGGLSAWTSAGYPMTSPASASTVF